MNIPYEKAKVKIFAWSMVDTIDLFFFSGIIDEYFHSKNLDSLKNATFDFMRDMLEEGLMKAGDLPSDNIFTPWNMTLDKIIETIKFKWDNLGRDLHPQEIVWFEITEKGKKEYEYLEGLPELAPIPIPYLKVFDGGKKVGDAFFTKFIENAKLVREDKLKKIKVYQLKTDGTHIIYREKTKCNSPLLEIHFSKDEKNILLEFREDA
jgi:hypothetical protein